MLDVIKETFFNDNIENDKQIINELVEGFSGNELKEFKKVALELMESQNIHNSFYKVMYRNAYKYIVCRRLYKKEIETYTQKKILGDYISLTTRRWVTLKRGI